jgi:Uma2 family endonuclease
LVIEVADSSSPYDCTVKVRLYAAAGIPETWLTHPNAHTITLYRRPTPEGYQEVREHRPLEQIALEAFPDERFRVDELVG